MFKKRIRARHKLFPVFVWILALFLLVTLSESGGAGGRELSPYLQAVSADGVYVLVETKTPDPVQVRYGSDALERTAQENLPTMPTHASTTTYVHRIRLSGLNAHTVYYYRVVQNGVESEIHRFTTAALPGTSFRFAWMADCQYGVSVHEAIAARIRAAAPAFSIYGGDLCDRDSHSRWIREFFTPNERALIAEVPFFLTTGDHEGWHQNTEAYVISPESKSGTMAYYSFDYGDAHFLAINTEFPVEPDSPQAQFIRKDLASVKKPWIIAFSHRPAYCAGGHNENEEMIALAKNVLKPGRIDLLLSGHSHFYQHNLVDGIHYLVISSAGGDLYKPEKAAYTLKSVMAHSYAVVDVTPRALHLAVYNEAGEVLDTLEFKK